MDLYNLSEIETELRVTSDAACVNGMTALLESKKISIDHFMKNKEKYGKEFMVCCHDGFKKAQDRIISNVIIIQEEQEKIKEELKKARIQKNKTDIAVLQKKEKHLEFTATLFKHCADALVWQLIQGQLWISRRLYLKVGGSKKLKDVNLKSAITVANKINSNPLNFALITDITNNVQVGDLIGFIDGDFVIAELKEGVKNFEVLEVIEELSSKPTKAEEIYNRYANNPKFIEHLERTIKQKKTLQDIVHILSTDKGIEPTSQKEIKILTPNEETPTYIKRLSALEKQLSERKFWAYDIIDDCLHIGIYKGEQRFGGAALLQAIADGENKSNVVIVDILSVIKSLNKPIFYLPFSVDFIFDLIFQRTKLYFMLDLDNYMELYKNYDFTAEWATTKETAKANEIAKGYDILKSKNRGIKIKSKNNTDFDMWLSNGTLTRMFFEHVYPSYTAYSTHYYIQPSDKEENTNT